MISEKPAIGLDVQTGFRLAVSRLQLFGHSWPYLRSVRCQRCNGMRKHRSTVSAAEETLPVVILAWRVHYCCLLFNLRIMSVCQVPKCSQSSPAYRTNASIIPRLPHKD